MPRSLAMALYQDPAKLRPRPSLIRDLLTIPAKVGNHQIENQATCVLAWLVDQSPVFARAVVELFAADAIEVVEPIGARTWISLPKPGGGAVFPDLSIEGTKESFQLLVEVKVGSEFHAHELPDGSLLLQPDFYRYAWEHAPPGPEARNRAVGTLTRLGEATAVRPPALCARDVTWSQVRGVLDGLLARRALEEPVRLVAASFLEAIAAQIAVDPPDPVALKAWLAEHKPVVHAVAERVMALIPGLTATSGGGRQFVARRVRIEDVLGQPLFVRIYASPAGSGLTLAGWPDGLIVGIERDADGTLEPEASAEFQAAGFLLVRDTAGFWLHRELWPMEDAKRDPAATAAQIANALLDTGLVRG